MLESLNRFFGILIIIYLFDILYLFTINKTTSIYSNIKQTTTFDWKPYFIYIILALAIQSLVLAQADIGGFKSVLKSAPILGLVIFAIYGFNNIINIPDKWNWTLFTVDILRGFLLITITSLLYYGISQIGAKKPAPVPEKK